MEYIKLPKVPFELPCPKHESNPNLSIYEDYAVLCVTCPECGKTFRREMTVETAKLVREYYATGGRPEGKHVQDVLPDWTAAERELFLMSHLCDDCWTKIIGR